MAVSEDHVEAIEDDVSGSAESISYCRYALRMSDNQYIWREMQSFRTLDLLTMRLAIVHPVVIVMTLRRSHQFGA